MSTEFFDGTIACPTCSRLMTTAGRSKPDRCSHCGARLRQESREPLKLEELSREKLLGIVLEDVSLIRRGVWLAEQREMRVSYAMELHGMLEMLDVLIGRVKSLAAKEVSGGNEVRPLS